jgi:hypothetical protein
LARPLKSNKPSTAHKVPLQPATVQMASADFGMKLGSFGDLEVSAWLETAHKRLNLRH